MYKLIAVILVLSTLCIVAFRPQMHKTLFVYDSDYKIVETVRVETVKNIPTQVNTPTKTEVRTVQKKVVTPVRTTTQKPLDTKVIKTETKAPVVKTVQTTAQTVTNPLLTMLEEPQQVKKEVVKEVAQVPSQIKTVSEEEKARQEVILWNQWRSNLQNKIMSDVKLPIMPEGTIFKFSFDVDKYGKISNVQTWSLTPNCTPYAIQYIAPVIRGYQGREILNFPAGSNRISTTVEGGWKISQTAKFSTPEDYKDSEKIIFKE